MKFIITLLLGLFVSSSYAQEIKDKKEILPAITTYNANIAIKEELIARKEVQLIQAEEDIKNKARFLEEAREELVTQAINARDALNNREKEIQKKEQQNKIKLKKQLPITQSLTDLIEKINLQHPIK